MTEHFCNLDSIKNDQPYLLEHRNDLAVRKLRLLHAELSLYEKILPLTAFIGRGDYRTAEGRQENVAAA